MRRSEGGEMSDPVEVLRRLRDRFAECGSTDYMDHCREHADAIDAVLARLAEAERERDEARGTLRRRVAFFEEVDEREDQGWCSEHPRMFSLRPGEEGDGDCHACARAAAEAREKALRSELEQSRQFEANIQSDLDVEVVYTRQLREALVRYVDDDAPCEYGGLEDCPGTPQFAPCRLHQARAALSSNSAVAAEIEDWTRNELERRQ
jgi:hypothetical protein